MNSDGLKFRKKNSWPIAVSRNMIRTIGEDDIVLKITGRIWAACFIPLANLILRKSLVRLTGLDLINPKSWPWLDTADKLGLCDRTKKSESLGRRILSVFECKLLFCN